MNFDLAAIVPEKISEARIKGLVLSTLNRYEKKIKLQLEATTNTFETVSVDFETKVSYSGGEAKVSVTTQSDIWHYLDEGTEERWAIMNSPFGSKTHPDELISTGGQRTYNKAGEYTAVRGRKAMMERGLAARDGIEARNWSTQVVELYEDIFILDIEEALRGGMEG